MGGEKREKKKDSNLIVSCGQENLGGKTKVKDFFSCFTTEKKQLSIRQRIVIFFAVFHHEKMCIILFGRPHQNALNAVCQSQAPSHANWSFKLIKWEEEEES